jgi:DNA-binding GntR family transcriptional regulator
VPSTRPTPSPTRSSAQAHVGLAATLAPWRPHRVAGVAKYAELRNTLLAAIQSGLWKPGKRLPTEQQLARELPYSLGTVQRALRELVDDGLVVRVQGQGTFVAQARKTLEAPWHCRYLDDTGRGHLPVYPHVLLRKRTAARGPWSDVLDQRGDNIVRIDRTLNVDDRFVVYSRFFLNADLFGAMLDKPLQELDAANFKSILDREFHLPVTRLSQTLSIATFPPEACRGMKLPRGTRGSVLEALASAGRVRNVYFQQFYLPATDRRLVISDVLGE